MGLLDFLEDVKDTVCDKVGDGFDYVCENPVKCAAVLVAGVATGGAALTFAGPIAATAGAAGLLGSASTGTAISTLTGAALTNASLAALGGGAVAAGGGGIVAGTAVVAGAGAVTGAAAGVGAAKVTEVVTKN